MTEPLLRVEGLTKHFPVTRGVFSRVVGQVRAVDGVSFDIAPGETLGLVGESGSGKTTIGRCILRLTEPSSGRVVFDGRDVAAAAGPELKRLRRELQVIFQDPFSSLNPRLRIVDIVGEALTVHGLARGPEVERRVATLLERVGLSPRFLHRYPHEFSGGQRQRIGVARALALSPKLIVCDEAVSALDVSIQAQVINLLVELRREMGISYLFIAHDLSVVRHVSHRVAVMYLGRLAELGPSRRVFEAPAHPYTRALLSAIPAPKPGPRPHRLVLTGEIPSPANPPSGCHFHTRCPAVRRQCRDAEPHAVEVEPGHLVHCVHAYDLPPGDKWHSELSHRIQAATAENTAAERASRIASAEPSEPFPEVAHGWQRREERPADGEKAHGARPALVAALTVAALGLVLTLSGHVFSGVLTAAVAYVTVLRRYARSHRAQDLAVAAALSLAVLASHGATTRRKVALARKELHALTVELDARTAITGAPPASLTELGWRLYPIFPEGTPEDPWGHPFRYRPPGGASRRFALSSTGPDGVPSPDDVTPP